ncbi:hypothetical protein HOLleu_07572 [Holothuria leucospilota]|uniref:Helix-turn-helix domain-containing protein n=1 Tax=Holothuria leucospilota TaxID=206669 RepID=A0A9Q1CHA6_HOLLE|nr:hypothetical protein HOLleu_07572 [Holothuria leucospilota]
MAPGNACLGMGLMEEKLWETFPLKPTEWCRHIDDIWGIWPHGKDAFLSWKSNNQKLFPGELEFTAAFSNTSLPFLDLSLTLSNDVIHTKLFTKSLCTDPMYVNYSSFHPRNVLDNIAYSQALRFNALCSENSDKEKCFLDLEKNLVSRGYPSKIVHEKISKADGHSRAHILKKASIKKSNRTKFKAPVVVTRNPHHPPFRDIFQKHFHILQLSTIMRKEIKAPPKVVFRTPPNLRKLLVHSTLKADVEPPNAKGLL